MFAEIDEYYADVRYERIAILNALGAYYSYLGKIETKHREKEDYFVQATKYYNKASRIDMHEPSTWIGKGKSFMLYMYVLYCYFEFFSFGFIYVTMSQRSMTYSKCWFLIWFIDTVTFLILFVKGSP